VAEVRKSPKKEMDDIVQEAVKFIRSDESDED
jgi:hypothetical protein